MVLADRIAKLEEAFELLEKKKKKPYDSVTYTTGDPDLNIAHFNKMLSGKEDSNHTSGYLNGTFKHDNDTATTAAKAVGTFAAPSPDGASSVSFGGDAGSSASSGGEGGGMGESLELTEDSVFAAKMGGRVELPPEVKLIPQKEVEDIVKQISPEEPFTVGYVTPIFFYKKLLDKFTLIKCTEMAGFTGVDYRDAATSYKGHDDRVKKAQSQIDNPGGNTVYGHGINKENSKVKSYVVGMRKDYGDINKTVLQADKPIYEIDPTTGRVAKDAEKHPIVKEIVKDLKTILFYPMPWSTPKVSYYIDLKKGKGYQEVSRDLLQATIYRAVQELVERDLATGAISDTEDMSESDEIFLKNVVNKVKAVIDQDAKTVEDKVLSTEYKPSVRALYTNQIYFIKTNTTTLGKALLESLTESQLDETKRYVRRYYMKPQNIPLSNKDEVLKALIDHEDEDCVVYTLNNLGDTKDFNKLTDNDIIYYYEDGILYDKNHVRIMDYELSIKKEEERAHINPETTSDAKFAQVYQDRMTGITDLEEAFDLSFDSYNVYGEKLTEGAEEHVCCICKDKFVGYGNNPEPYMSAENGEVCCDACNAHFVIPKRLELAMSAKEEK